jgi:hypothetical protein
MSSNFSSVSTRLLCFCFLSMKSPVDLSLYTTLSIASLLGTLSSRNLCLNFRISHTCFTVIHVAVRYTVPWRTILFTNCNWEQMAYDAGNCCLLLTNHKQKLTHEPHCSPWCIMPPSGPQFNYFPSIQTLSANKHTGSSGKFICASQPAVHRSPWSVEPWTGQQN